MVRSGPGAVTLPDESLRTMNATESAATGDSHKLFAVFTAPHGTLSYRKMWSRRLTGYLAGIGAVQGTGWEAFVENAEWGQVWNVPLESGTWMTVIRIRDDEDRNDTV